MITLGLAALLALGVALYIAPKVMEAAYRYGILDVPDGALKTQREPVAYLGGLVVFMAMVVSLAVTQVFNERLLALLLGCALVVAVGLVDDLGTLVPKDKLLGQVLAATVMVKGGIHIQMDAVPWYVADLASVFWVVSITNAFNIIDVNDGQCAGVGTVAAVFLAGWLFQQGQVPEAFLCAALAGGLLGFLRHNWEPARMYLGDTGSMLVGFVLAAAAMLADWSDHNALAALVSPLAVMCVALFDLAFVIVVRAVLGLRIYHGSPDHFAVRLRRHGWKPRHVSMLAMVAGVVGAACAAAAALGSAAQAGAVAVAGLVACVVLGAVLWRFDPRRTA